MHMMNFLYVYVTSEQYLQNDTNYMDWFTEFSTSMYITDTYHYISVRENFCFVCSDPCISFLCLLSRQSVQIEVILKLLLIDSSMYSLYRWFPDTS